MTCIVAVKDKGNVVIGSDSVAVDGGDIYTTNAKKIIRLGPFLIGIAGWNRYSQSLSHQKLKKADNIETDSDARDYLETTFADSLIALGKKLELDEKGTYNTFLLAWRDHLYEVYADYTVQEIDDSWAVGSGQDVALGSLWTSFEIGGYSAVDRASMALDAAAAYKNNVRGPMKFEWSI